MSQCLNLIFAPTCALFPSLPTSQRKFDMHSSLPNFACIVLQCQTRYFGFHQILKEMMNRLGKQLFSGSTRHCRHIKLGLVSKNLFHPKINKEQRTLDLITSYGAPGVYVKGPQLLPQANGATLLIDLLQVRLNVHSSLSSHVSHKTIFAPTPQGSTSALRLVSVSITTTTHVHLS